jgi:gamma-butyrobetaine dioxygenase
VVAAGNGLDVTFSDGLSARFHALWLRDNCPSRRTTSNQKALTSGTAVLGAELSAARAQGDGAHVEVDWAGAASSSFTAVWLHQHAHRPNSVCSGPLAERRELPRLPYASVCGDSEQAVYEWARHLTDMGVCILEGAPDGCDSVCVAAERIAPVQQTIYGRAWDVVDTPDAINVAYTSVALALHMDLAYYESPPGLQLLHCRRFDEQVDGGESVLLDAIEAAALFERAHPDEFAVLTRVPATFIKEHFQRERPVCMRYRRPHIALNAAGAITAVFWAPPFDGPLEAPADDVEPYYRAYACFESFLASLVPTRGWIFRLRAGEIATFNNRRLLHGRNAFTSNGGVRALRGCYVNIDEFASRFATLSREFGADGRPEAGLPKLGNQDSASGFTLPV